MSTFEKKRKMGHLIDWTFCLFDVLHQLKNFLLKEESLTVSSRNKELMQL